jgi:dsRNA-specific ribonuclease
MLSSNIYLGSRGPEFKNIIVHLLERGKLKPQYINQLTNSKSMKLYGHAFTGSTADPENNYERFEQLGDVTANKFIIWYAYRRFPQLDCTDGVKVVARLRINYGAKQFFAPLGEKLGFWPFISAAEEGTERNKYYRRRNKKDLLEDTFEAFVGCTEYLLDKAFRPGVGYAVVYDILENIFDEIDMSIKYEDLYDAKTRLKETFDTYKKELGNWIFINERDPNLGMISRVYRILEGSRTSPFKEDGVEKPQKGWIKIGKGIALKKSDAEQKAAQTALITLKNNGFFKVPPEEYKYVCEK